MKKEAFYRTDVDDDDDFLSVLDQILTWRKAHYKGCEANFTLYFERIEQQSQRRLPPLPPATPQPRLTATLRQQTALNEELSTESAQATGRPRGVALRNRWTCTQQSCINHGAFCFWSSTNSPEHHVPISKETVEAWSRDIQAGRQTIDRPSIEVFNLMRLAKERQLAKSHNHAGLRKQQQQQHQSQLPFNLFQNFDPRSSAFLPTVIPPLTAPVAAAPSPVFEPESSPTALVELLDEFFDWCEQRVDWRS